MSIRKIRNSWWVDFRHNFTRYRKKSPQNSQGGAREYEALLRQRLARGEPLEPKVVVEEKVTFAAFAARWFDTYVTVNSKPSDRATKASTLRRHLIPSFGHLPLPQVSAESIERYKAQRLAEGLTAKTVNNHLNVLTGCLRRSVDWGYLERLPAVKRLKTRSLREDFLLEEECERLLGSDDASLWHRMALVGLHTGMRFGELAGLDWSAVHLAERRLTVERAFVKGEFVTPKNHKVRHLPLTDDVVDALTPHARSEGLVFPARGDRPVTHSAARHHLTRLCRQTGVRVVGWHVLRHTFASLLSMKGLPLRVIQGFLGHGSITTTERYAHLAPSSLDEAVRLLNGVGKQAVVGNRRATPSRIGDSEAHEEDLQALLSPRTTATI